MVMMKHEYHATLTQAQERIEDAIQSQEYEGDMFIFYVQYHPYNTDEKQYSSGSTVKSSACAANEYFSLITQYEDVMMDFTDYCRTVAQYEDVNWDEAKDTDYYTAEEDRMNEVRSYMSDQDEAVDEKIGEVDAEVQRLADMIAEEDLAEKSAILH